MNPDQNEKLHVFRSVMFHMINRMRIETDSGITKNFSKKLDLLKTDYKTMSSAEFIKKWDRYWLQLSV